MSKSIVVCPKCRRAAHPLPNDEGSNEAVILYFAVSCPWVPDEMNPLGIGGRMLCPMAAARHAQQLQSARST